MDFGLAVFNYNYPNEGNRDGGRIVSGITQMTDSTRASLLTTIDNLLAKTNTPLCETMYEAYRYFAGKGVKYGHGDTDYGSYVGNKPPYDSLVEKGGATRVHLKYARILLMLFMSLMAHLPLIKVLIMML